MILTNLNLETYEIVEDNDIKYKVRCSFHDYISKVLLYTKQPLLLYWHIAFKLNPERYEMAFDSIWLNRLREIMIIIPLWITFCASQ